MGTNCLIAIQFNKNVLGNIFNYRVVNYWNKLPTHIVTSPIIEIFKSRLSKINISPTEESNFW